jgi:hypothetical protein
MEAMAMAVKKGLSELLTNKKNTVSDSIAKPLN